jgi:hypothetical protein
MQSQLDSERKYTDDDIRQLREAVNHLVELNEELNSKLIAMDAWVKNGDAKNRAAQTYIHQLEWAITNYTKGND